MVTSPASRVPDRLPFEWLGGRLCLDFVNTVSWGGVERRNERLQSYGDLIRWAREAGLLTPTAAARLTRAAEAAPARAARALADAHALREALHQVFAARAAGRAPPSDATATLNRFLGRALGRLRLRAAADGCSWTFPEESDEPDRVLWPVAWSAAELLTSDDAGAIRMCAGERCGWLFLDRSRNRSRRWCDMRVCGNAAKVRRFYARRKAASEAARQSEGSAESRGSPPADG